VNISFSVLLGAGYTSALRAEFKLLAVSMSCLLWCAMGCRHFEAREHRRPTVITLTGQPATNLSDGCPDHYDPAVDYFPEKISFEYAQQIRVTYHRNYKVIEFNPSVHTKETFRYLLVQCGTPAPQGYDRVHTVQVPVQRFTLNHPEFGAAAVRLGLLERLVGVPSLMAYSLPEIVDAGRRGAIHEVGSRGHAALEPTVAVDPDVAFLFYSAFPNANLHPQLWQLGVEGVPLASHFEPLPLGRSEWIKFFALFFNRERQAEAMFAPAARRYEDLARLTAAAAKRPEVLLGIPSGRDIWALYGGRNFMSQLVWDAGGHYFWQDQQAGSLVLADYERVFDESLDTAVWVGGNGVNRISTRQELIRNDPRLEFFAPVEHGDVFAGDRGMDKRRAMPYSDQSLDKPDVVLADFVAALHPELVPGHKPVFLRKLE
jgi:iron complex transport system substrate-binding protein